MTDTTTPQTSGKNSPVITDFGIDTTAQSTMDSVRGYLARLRGGELGTLPALLGLAVLVAYFSYRSEFFLTLDNIANLFQQSAGQIIIAMGLVFVLLLGEIDLSAGTASGVCASIMALHFLQNGNLQGGMHSNTYWLFVGFLALAMVLGVLMRIWAGAVLSLLALVLVVSGLSQNAWIEMLLALSVGTAIGVITGFLVSKIGMPSFVVTLALFIAWQGVILEFIGDRGSIRLGKGVLDKVANGNLSVTWSWVFCAVAVLAYAGWVLGEHVIRLRRGLVTQPTPVVLFKVGVIAAIAIVVTYAFSLNRAQNANIVIKGVPYVVPIVLVLLAIGTYVLNRTRYGRHIYAVGGNAEAARRAGINVSKIRASVFVVCSSAAAIGAIVYSSKAGSVDPQAGGLNTLLFAVGAAVIGGTSLFGGRGKVVHAVIGGLVLGVVANGLGLLRYSPGVVNMITGLVLLVAATVDALSRRRAAALAG